MGKAAHKALLSLHGFLKLGDVLLQPGGHLVKVRGKLPHLVVGLHRYPHGEITLGQRANRVRHPRQRSGQNIADCPSKQRTRRERGKKAAAIEGKLLCAADIGRRNVKNHFHCQLAQPPAKLHIMSLLRVQKLHAARLSVLRKGGVLRANLAAAVEPSCVR